MPGRVNTAWAIKYLACPSVLVHAFRLLVYCVMSAQAGTVHCHSERSEESTLRDS